MTGRARWRAGWSGGRRQGARLAAGAAAVVGIVLVAAWIGGCGSAYPGPGGGGVGGGVPPVELCAQTPNDRLCSFLPHDVIETLNAGYSQIGAAQQRPFDNFSWQSFVALNWPADAAGNPQSRPIGTNPAAPRVWMSYPTTFDVFGLSTAAGQTARPDACSGLAAEGDVPVFQLMSKSDQLEGVGDAVVPGGILEATGQPLIDRNLNFTLYDIRLNDVEADYLRSSGLNTLGGQIQFKDSGKQVSFPLGDYADPLTRTGGSVGAIEVKTAWRILQSGDDAGRVFHTPGLVFVAAANSDSGRAFCFQATLGLVGFHVIHRTSGPADQPQDWAWSTFEHVDNAPLATNAADPTSTSPGPTTCTAPTPAGQSYSYFDAACSGCATNQPPPLPPGEALYKWATSPPYARRYATQGKYGTQVVRCWRIYPETAEVNRVFQRALAGTPWANYFLVNTQWQGGIEDPETENGNIPRFLGNTTLETYVQSTASCLQCHSFAKTAVGQDANFSFLLGIPRLMSGHTAGEPAEPMPLDGR